MLPVVVRTLLVHARAASVLRVAIVTMNAWSAAAQPTPAARAEWDLFLGTSSQVADFRALAVTEQGLLVGATERTSMEPTDPGPTRLLLWNIAADGHRRTETELTEFPAGAMANSRTIRDVAALPGGDALVLADFVAGHPSLVRVDAKGEQVATRRVLPEHRVATLMQMLPVAGGRHLLIGHEGFNALAVLVDATGAALWDRVYDRGQMEYFVDGLSLTDGSTVLVGNTGTYDAYRAGPSTVWVGRYDASGIAKGEVTFAGRHGRIVATGDGGCALVYDRSATMENDIHVKRLGPNFEELWDVALVSAPHGNGDFRIGRFADGTFAIAGGGAGRAQVAFVDASGRRTGGWRGDGRDKAIDIGAYGLATDATGAVLLATSHVEARSRADVKFRVRVRRIERAVAERGL